MSQLTSASLAATMLLLLAATAAATTSALAGSDCQNDIQMLETTCYKYVAKDAPTSPPSQECCDTMNGVDVPCVCSYLGAPGIKENISMEKVFYVAQQCGVSIPGNCGGKQFELVTSLSIN